MKITKISIIIASILSTLLILGIIFIVIFSNNKKEKEGYRTLQESKSFIYEEGRRMTFNVYSDTYLTLLDDVKNNTYELDLLTEKYTLYNVEVKKYKIDGATLIKISSDIPDIFEDVSSDNAKLMIYTTKYKLALQLGSITIIRPDEYELLGIDSLYGSYSNINGMNHLVGVNITFSKNYNKLNNFKIGEFTYGTLSKSIIDTKLKNEINISDYIYGYSPYAVERDKSMTLESKTYFIPLGYQVLYPIKEGFITMELDNKKYYLDVFNFMSNDYSYKEHKDYMKEGVFVD